MEKGYTYGTAPQKREWELSLSFKTLKICGVNCDPPLLRFKLSRTWCPQSWQQQDYCNSFT